tara:strand:+ start:10186 stop:12318 length:2133 start_codon:yes stop_codon:yes gene_type:complete
MKELQDIKLDLNESFSAYYDRNRLCLDDYEFAVVTGAMWKGSYAEQFKNKPKPEINKIYGAINRLLGQKQRLEMNATIISNSDEATDEDAEALQSRWRNDFQSGNGNEALNNADQEAYFSGFGAFKEVAKYEDEENPDPDKQYLCLEPIYSAASSVIFSPSLRKDKSDSKQCWHIIRTNRKTIEEEYGVSVSSINAQIDWFDWSTDTDKDIYLAHYYEVVTKNITTYDFGGGYVIASGDGIKDGEGNKVTREELTELKDLREHTVIKKKVKRVEYALISGDQFLIKKQLTPFKRIPIFPQYGYYNVINGIEYFCGEVRKRKDPQMFLNTYHSSLMEIMAAPQVEKPEYTPEQIAEHAGQRARADIDNMPFVMSDPIKNPDGSIAHLGPIGRQTPPQIGSGLAMAGQALEANLLEMSGTGQSTLPSNAAADAVRQVNERQDDTFQPLIQNSMSAIKSACEAWIDAAQILYFSNPRKLRVQGLDGSHSQLETLQYDVDGDGNYGPYKNSARGRYTVQVKMGESFKSKKEAELDTTLKMLQFADSSSPQGQILLNQAILSTTGEGGARSRKIAQYQIIDNMLALGIDPKPKDDDEKAYVQQKIQQMEQAAQQQQEDPLIMLERMKEENIKLARENDAVSNQIQIAKMQEESEGKREKLQVEVLAKARSIEQAQQKIDNDKENNDFNNALELLKVELQEQKDLNKQLMSNMTEQ